jgi:hypothetical protein
MATGSSSSKVVTFTRPFRLSSMNYRLPAGSYTVETDEERSAYRPRGTFIRIPLPFGAAGASSHIMIDPAELEAALARDAAPEAYGSETVGEHAQGEGSRP